MDAKLYCVCRKPEGSNRLMIECCCCLEWFHCSCVGLASQRSKLPDIWLCPKCTQGAYQGVAGKKLLQEIEQSMALMNSRIKTLEDSVAKVDANVASLHAEIIRIHSEQTLKTVDENVASMHSTCEDLPLSSNKTIPAVLLHLDNAEAKEDGKPFKQQPSLISVLTPNRNNVKVLSSQKKRKRTVLSLSQQSVPKKDQYDIRDEEDFKKKQ